MRKLLKIDFKRAICSKQFIIVIIIGILLSLIQIYTRVLPYFKYYKLGSSYFNPFVKWMNTDGFNIYNQLFLFLFPALASLPYSDSYWVDKSSGFNKGIYTRANKKDYFVSRYITNFIIGGAVVVVPLILNFYILSMMLPSVSPSVFNVSTISKDMFYNLYYFHPYIYVTIYIGLAFIYGGVFASLGLAVSHYCKNKFLVVTTPVLIYLSMYIFELANLPYLVPAKFLSAGQPVFYIKMTYIIIIFLILFISSLILYIKGASRDEGI